MKDRRSVPGSSGRKTNVVSDLQHFSSSRSVLYTCLELQRVALSVSAVAPFQQISLAPLSGSLQASVGRQIRGHRGVGPGDHQRWVCHTLLTVHGFAHVAC